MQQADIEKLIGFISVLYEKEASPEAVGWLGEKIQKVSEADSPKELFLAFSAAPRFTGRGLLHPEKAELEKAEALRPGFDPSNWTLAQTARTLLLLATPSRDEGTFLTKTDQLFSTAEMGELVALYASLPLLPYPEAFRLRAAEGVRTNMGTVFDAIALDNPYPADYLEEGAWNQMVLKTVFTGKPLYRIYGLEKCSNPTLARILSDYAHERWAANRLVTPELWRLVGPYINESLLGDIKKLFSHPDPLQQEAAALACSQGSFVKAKELLEARPSLKKRIETGELSWDYIGKKSLTAI